MSKREGSSYQTTNSEQLKGSILNVLANIPSEFLLKSVKAVPREKQKMVDNAGAYVEL